MGARDIGVLTNLAQKRSSEMGLRGIDVQVAINRANDADKIQQSDTANARAGEAAAREEVKETRTRKQQQTPETEKTDQIIIQHHKEKERKDRDEEEKREGEDEILEETSVRKPMVQGSLDIKA